MRICYFLLTSNQTYIKQIQTNIQNQLFCINISEILRFVSEHTVLQCWLHQINRKSLRKFNNQEAVLHLRWNAGYLYIQGDINEGYFPL